MRPAQLLMGIYITFILKSSGIIMEEGRKECRTVGTNNKTVFFLTKGQVNI